MPPLYKNLFSLKLETAGSYFLKIYKNNSVHLGK